MEEEEDEKTQVVSTCFLAGDCNSLKLILQHTVPCCGRFLGTNAICMCKSCKFYKCFDTPTVAMQDFYAKQICHKIQCTIFDDSWAYFDQIFLLTGFMNGRWMRHFWDAFISFILDDDCNINSLNRPNFPTQ